MVCSLKNTHLDICVSMFIKCIKLAVVAAVACTRKNENPQVLFNLLSQKVGDSLNVINLKEFCNLFCFFIVIFC